MGPMTLRTAPGSETVTYTLVSAPGLTQTSLQTLLESLNGTGRVSTCSGCLSALKLLEKRPSSYLIIDANIPSDEAVLLIKELKLSPNDIHCVALAETVRQERRLYSAGVDAVLRRVDLIPYVKQQFV